MNIKNVKAIPRSFTLKDGSTFRLLPKEKKNVPDSKVTDEIKRNIKLGDLQEIKKPVPKKSPKKGEDK